MNRPDSPSKKQSSRAAGSLKRERLHESTFRRKALGTAAFLILAASALNALLGERGVLGLTITQQKYASLAAQVSELEAENDRLSSEIRSLRSDPLVLEGIAREVFGMGLPGEISVSIRYTDAPR
jgi:cell division protein FtsB